MFQMFLMFLIFRKSKTPKSSETSRPPQKCQNPIFVIFGYRGNTHLHAKKDRMSKDCFIEKFFGTQPYMQIPVMDTSVSGHKQCLYIQFA